MWPVHLQLPQVNDHSEHVIDILQRFKTFSSSARTCFWFVDELRIRSVFKICIFLLPNEATGSLPIDIN